MSTPEDKLIAAFRTRLASDPRLRAEFLDAPFGVLRREGVQVTPQEAELLRLEVAAPEKKPAPYHPQPFLTRMRRPPQSS